MRRRALLSTFLAAGITAGIAPAASTARAQDAAANWPNKPVRVIVNFGPGGSADNSMRPFADRLSRALGQQFVIENKSGAGGIIGTDFVAKSAPDGYTLLMTIPGPITANLALYKKLPYDPLKDLVPVVLLGTGPVAIVVRADSPYKTLKDLLDAARKKPGSVTYATPGNGTVSHLTGVRLQKVAGVKLEHIPYKGSSGAIPDLLNGSVDAYLATVPSVQSQLAAGSMRAIAVTSLQRSQILPNVPAVAETYPGFDAVTWFGVLMPAGTPAPVVARMNEAINAALKSPDVRAKIAADGGDVLGGSAEDFAKVLRSDVATWGAVVRESGARID